MGESKIRNLKSKISMSLIAVAVFVADQVTKSIVERRISESAVVRVIPGFFNLINTKNSGAVFGIFSDSSAWWKTPLLIVVSVTLLIAVVALIIRTQNLQWATSLGLALVLGGAISNLFDRVRSGLVEDFLDFYIRSYHWATFNLADSAIVVGTGFIILKVLLGE
jgi:signal peptidase II